MRISDWSSDVCSSYLPNPQRFLCQSSPQRAPADPRSTPGSTGDQTPIVPGSFRRPAPCGRQAPPPGRRSHKDTKSVGWGKRVAVRVDLRVTCNIKRKEDVKRKSNLENDFSTSS